MELLLEPEQICNPKNYPNCENLTTSISKISFNYELSKKLRLIWENISDFYLTKYVCSPFSDAFNKKLNTELLLRTLSILSTYTSPFIEGVDNFIKSSEIYDNKTRFTYSTKKSFVSFTKHLIATQPEEAKTSFFSELDNTHSYS